MSFLTNNYSRLNNFQFLFNGLIYPVESSDQIYFTHHEKQFLITGMFQDPRPVSFKNEVIFTPHYAIDIANVSNIYDISSTSKIIRNTEIPGYIVAIANGTVVNIGYSNTLGWHIEIEHDIKRHGVDNFYPYAKHWTSLYAHMDKSFGWKVGDTLKQGQKIGLIGSSGFSTGPHLHFEVHIYLTSGLHKGVLGRYNRVSPFAFQQEKGY